MHQARRRRSGGPEGAAIVSISPVCPWCAPGGPAPRQGRDRRRPAFRRRSGAASGARLLAVLVLFATRRAPSFRCAALCAPLWGRCGGRSSPLMAQHGS